MDFPAEQFGGPDLDMWVISNDKSIKGASAILDKEFLTGFAQQAWIPKNSDFAQLDT